VSAGRSTLRIDEQRMLVMDPSALPFAMSIDTFRQIGANDAWLASAPPGATVTFTALDPMADSGIAGLPPGRFTYDWRTESGSGSGSASVWLRQPEGPTHVTIPGAVFATSAESFFRLDNPMLWLAALGAVGAFVFARRVGVLGGLSENLIVKGSREQVERELFRRRIPWIKIHELRNKKWNESVVTTPALDEDRVRGLVDWFNETSSGPPPKRGFRPGTLLHWR